MTTNRFVIAAAAGIMCLPGLAGAATPTEGTHLTGATEAVPMTLPSGATTMVSSTDTVGTHESGATEAVPQTEASGATTVASSSATVGTHESGATEAVAQTLPAAGTQMASTAMTAPDAQMHYKAIASADLSEIMSQYAPSAQLQWIGGPLNGSYEGHAQIRKVWQKYVSAMGKGSETAKDIKVSNDAKGMTVTANVDFGGKKNVPVRLVLVYRDKKIVSEVWQVQGTSMG